jgi:hypothetical protein
MSKAQPRRLSRIVHDHKGNAKVEWYEAPSDEERLKFEIESTATRLKVLNAGSLSVQSEESFNPYMSIPESERKRVPGQKTDLRKLSAWIKMMRELEEARKRGGRD